MTIFHDGNLISWSSRKQHTAIALGTMELLYLKGISTDFKKQEEDEYMFLGNQSAIKMIETSNNTKRSKH